MRKRTWSPAYQAIRDTVGLDQLRAEKALAFLDDFDRNKIMLEDWWGVENWSEEDQENYEHFLTEKGLEPFSLYEVLEATAAGKMDSVERLGVLQLYMSTAAAIKGIEFDIALTWKKIEKGPGKPFLGIERKPD